MTENSEDTLANLALRHVEQLLNAPRVPQIPSELAEDKTMHAVHETFMGLRSHLALLSRGDLTQDVQARGYLAGLIKMHVANLRHLTWQVEQVAEGDFSQYIDFMGEFSVAFNYMVDQLGTTLTALRETEETLTKLTTSLQHEVEQRSSAEARFKYLAEHDPLTGTLNRRSFLAVLEEELKLAAQQKLPCCISLLDVDNFKTFNDTYGHIEGDAALKHIVTYSAASLRKQDHMGRYGGEEFIFCFTNTDLVQGTRAAERIRQAIAASHLDVAGTPRQLTASMGVCVIQPEWLANGISDSFVQQMISVADKALYAAKAAGRDQVCDAPITPPKSFSQDKTSKAKK